jgi:hypothetical protein
MKGVACDKAHIFFAKGIEIANRNIKGECNTSITLGSCSKPDAGKVFRQHL